MKYAKLFFFFCTGALAGSSGAAQAEAAAQTEMSGFFFLNAGALAGSSGCGGAQAEAAAETEMWGFFFVNAGALAGSSGCAEADAAADTEMPDAGGFVQLAQVQRHTDVGKGQENRGTYSVRPHTLVATGPIH